MVAFDEVVMLIHPREHSNICKINIHSLNNHHLPDRKQSTIEMICLKSITNVSLINGVFVHYCSFSSTQFSCSWTWSSTLQGFNSSIPFLSFPSKDDFRRSTGWCWTCQWLHQTSTTCSSQIRSIESNQQWCQSIAWSSITFIQISSRNDRWTTHEWKISVQWKIDQWFLKKRWKSNIYSINYLIFREIVFWLWINLFYLFIWFEWQLFFSAACIHTSDWFV